MHITCRLNNLSKTEGIILNALKFQDYDQILTLFTLNEGLVKILVKGAFGSKNGRGTMTTPLTHGEFVYSRGKSELWKCVELSSINQHLNLRQNLAFLEAAFDLVQATVESQMLHKPAPHLYQLLLLYLKKIPIIADPRVLSASYRLKLLRHEGLFALNPSCSICGTDLCACFLSQGECFCKTHAPFQALSFNADEFLSLKKLTYSRKFSEMNEIKIDLDFFQKIKYLFTNTLTSNCS